MKRLPTVKPAVILKGYLTSHSFLVDMGSRYYVMSAKTVTSYSLPPIALLFHPPSYNYSELYL